MADFNRFDICEAYFLIACDWGEYETIARLYKMGFKASPILSYETLSDNGQEIYNTLDRKLSLEVYGKIEGYL